MPNDIKFNQRQRVAIRDAWWAVEGELTQQSLAGQMRWDKLLRLEKEETGDNLLTCRALAISAFLQGMRKPLEPASTLGTQRLGFTLAYCTGAGFFVNHGVKAEKLFPLLEAAQKAYDKALATWVDSNK